MLEFSKIIFITDMDTSSGPLAAVLLRHHMQLENVEIDSRGLAVLFPEPMNPKTVAIAASKGFELNRTSEQLQNEEFGPKTLALVLEEPKKQTVYDDYSRAMNVYTLTEYINQAGSIANPDGGTLADYAKFYERLDWFIVQLADELKKNKQFS